MSDIEANKKIQTLLHKCLLFEFQQIKQFCPVGVYLAPDAKNLKLWNGISIIVDGYYKKCVVKFELRIPPTYPTRSPEVYFTNRIFHPLIDPNDGKLDLSKGFPNWTPGKNLLLNVLVYINDIFYNPDYLSVSDSFNPESAKLFLENQILFEEEVEKYSELSHKEHFSIQDNKQDIKIMKEKLSLLNQDKEISDSKRVEDFTKWFLSTYNIDANHKK